jgi:hypothetical protein
MEPGPETPNPAVPEPEPPEPAEPAPSAEPIVVEDGTSSEEAPAYSYLEGVDSIPSDLLLPFVLIALANNAVLTTVKQAIAIMMKEGGAKLNGGKVKAMLTLANPALGVICAVLPGVFPAELSTGVKALVGIVAGLFSIPIYKYVLKRYFPSLMVSSEHPSRTKTGK